ARLGFLPRVRSAARSRLFREHVWVRSRAAGGDVVERDSLQTVLPALDRDRGARGLGRQTNLGLDPANDAAKDRALSWSRLARLGCSRHPGIQPFYLFHFLET